MSDKVTNFESVPIDLNTLTEDQLRNILGDRVYDVVHKKAKQDMLLFGAACIVVSVDKKTGTITMKNISIWEDEEFSDS